MSPTFINIYLPAPSDRSSWRRFVANQYAPAAMPLRSMRPAPTRSMEFSVQSAPVSGRSVRTFTLVKVEAGMAFAGASTSPMTLPGSIALPMSSFTWVTVVKVVRPVYLPASFSTAFTVTATWYSALE